MDLFSGLTLIGGLCLFLFGMDIMGQALERCAGGKLRSLLGALTTNRAAGFVTGLGVTGVIQSSSATTVMVVGFVNSGLMTLRQAINVIMGANVGTTVTAWVLSLGGIQSDNIWVRLFKPSSFTPALALIGILLYMFGKTGRKKDAGTIFLGFATLMFGMDTMSGAVSGLANVPEFQNLFLLFQNPLLGVLAGALLTAIIQSSSASVGILQALALTGQISYGAAIPIIMGQNIGTCVTAMLSSVGANKNAKRAAMVHLSFNVIGTTVWLTVFWIIKVVFTPALLTQTTGLAGIAVAHSAFNILCTALLFPMAGLLERLVTVLVPDSKDKEEIAKLDARLLATPPLALEQCYGVTAEMANLSCETLRGSLQMLRRYQPEQAQKIRKGENKTDRYEDMLGNYLVQLSSRQISEAASAEAAELLKNIGDFERIADHGVNILESVEEMRDKNITFSAGSQKELEVLLSAVEEVMRLSLDAFLQQDAKLAEQVEPLEQVVDRLKDRLRNRHIQRMQSGTCSVAAGFIWSDLLTNLERTADHCSNIAESVRDFANGNLNPHESLREYREDNPTFRERYEAYIAQYELPPKTEAVD